MRLPIVATWLLLAWMLTSAGCIESKTTTPIPVPQGAVIEIYKVVAAQGANTKPAVDPTSGNPIHLVAPPVVLTSDIDTIAREETDTPNHPGLKIDLKPSGSRKMVAATTSANVSELALVVNGQVVAIPKVRMPIGGSMIVTGDTKQKGFAQALKLAAGP